MPLRIAFDLDGVLADMDAALLRLAEGLFGERAIRRLQDPEPAADPLAPSAAPAARDDAEITPPAGDSTAPETASDHVPPPLTLRLTERQQSRLWRHIETIEGFWESLNEIEPGVVARFGALAVDRRWEVIFLTKRPGTAGATAQVQSQRWLESKGFAHPSVYVVQGSRGRIAAALHLDFVIDDRPENCLDVVVDSKARAILVWRDDEKLLPAAARRLGVGVVKSVAECLDILTQVDSDPQERPGVVDRVMRLLGLKNEPASTPTTAR